jgi:SAM-dependent methyltransferase
LALASPTATSPRLYRELAGWWPLVSAPEDYAGEAEFVRRTLKEQSSRRVQTILELGCGGGNNASHLKRNFQLTLVDLSPQMLEVSAGLNPECEHIAGDMRTVRIGRTFDAVFVHDAVMYLTGIDDLRRAFETAFVHVEPGGVALFMPDCVRETFRARTDHGGHDGERRALRYLEWTYDPDPSDSTYTVDFAFLLREADGSIHLEHDRHIEGLFARDDWLRLLGEVGLRPRLLTDPWHREVFVAAKRA